MATSKKNIVLFIGNCNQDSLQAFQDLEKYLNRKLRVAFLMDKKAEAKHPELEAQCDFIFRVDAKKIAAAEDALSAIKDEVLVVTCRSVFYMPLYAQLIATFPHLVMPNSDTIDWCSNKLIMRRKFRRYFPEITPKFTAVHGATQADVEKVISKVGFPCIVKPASLAASRLVAICFHEEELQETLRKTFRGIRSVYRNSGALVEPEVIVEQFMEGTMYSIDGYVDATGEVIQLPAVHVKTGQDIGVDDFYNYRVLTPTRLTPEEEAKAQEVGCKAVKSLSLRACMVHMEFMKLDEGWKVLEVDARMGGHRDFMYREAFGIPHGLNDLLTRMGEKPIVRKIKKHNTACFNLFADESGRIKAIRGLKKVRELESLKILEIVTKVGQKTGLSKDGYKKVLDVFMSNPSRENLLADARRMEKSVQIELE
jgi:biotin carboxylase